MKPRTPTGHHRFFPAAAVILAVVLGAMAMACRDQSDDFTGPDIERLEPAGDPRNVRMGFSMLGAEQSPEGYVRAFATAAQYGDIISIQRTPPWDEFLPGRKISRQTAQTTRLEASLLDQYDHLQRFLAIDPTDGAVQRQRIANLPDSIDPAAGFSDPDLRKAFIDYTSYVVSNYQPDYLALGVEINMFADRAAPAQFESFLSLYREAYIVAKGLRPEMKVFVTFQLEDLLGDLSEVHPPQWDVIDRFAGSLDVLAISTYPYLTGLTSANALRSDYYTQLVDEYSGEIMIAETAYPSSPTEGSNVIGTQEDQTLYLLRLLKEANENNFVAVVWLAPLNPAFGGAGGNAILQDVGLRAADGANKVAWGYWEEWVRRPLADGR